MRGKIHVLVLSHVERTEVSVGALYLSLSLNTDDRLLEPYTAKKNLGYLNHILGRLSCISVTKECY